ncbi:MAG: hypothetical protein R2856_14070 [Caldilineaceae bacterium]
MPVPLYLILNYLHRRQAWRAENAQSDLALDYTQRAGIRIVEKMTTTAVPAGFRAGVGHWPSGSSSMRRARTCVGGGVKWCSKTFPAAADDDPQAAVLDQVMSMPSWRD